MEASSVATATQSRLPLKKRPVSASSKSNNNTMVLTPCSSCTWNTLPEPPPHIVSHTHRKKRKLASSADYSAETPNHAGVPPALFAPGSWYSMTKNTQPSSSSPTTGKRRRTTTTTTSTETPPVWLKPVDDPVRFIADEKRHTPLSSRTPIPAQEGLAVPKTQLTDALTPVKKRRRSRRLLVKRASLTLDQEQRFLAAAAIAVQQAAALFVTVEEEQDAIVPSLVLSHL